MKRLLTAVFLVAGCGAPPDVDSLGWLAMGTTAQLSFKTAEGPSAVRERRALGDVKEIFAEVEQKLSIWRSDSEISRYRSLDGVSPEMRPCYEAAFRLQNQSGGAFNPFWRGTGKGPDLGAIAKGFAVDLAAARLLRGGGPGRSLLIDLGGNLKVVSGEWKTGIRNPFGTGGILRTLTLTNGMACATSGEYERGKHIRDGRTRVPVTNDVASVTVVHPSSAMLADGLSTTLFVLGRAKGETFLKNHYPEAQAYWIMKR